MTNYEFLVWRTTPLLAGSFAVKAFQAPDFSTLLQLSPALAASNFSGMENWVLCWLGATALAVASYWPSNRGSWLGPLLALPVVLVAGPMLVHLLSIPYGLLIASPGIGSMLVYYGQRRW